MNKFLYFIVLVLFNSTAYSQYCGSDDFFNLYETETEETYRRIDSWIFERNDVEYILPVVIHVIHQSGPENISLAQIEQGIKWLNDAFSNQGVYQNNNGVNTKIQFCLAKRSESGHATDGVNRIYSPLTNYNFNGIDKDLKNLSRWEPLSYINIWLVNSLSWYGNASIAGYAYPPSVAGSQLDGMVLESEYFGKDKSLTVPLIHEMGHYLGLLHTFNGGCKNDNCLIDGDKVCDTPPDGVNIAISCNGSFKVNSCYTDEDDNSINNPFRDIGLGGIGDQVDLEDNFMDYGFYSCAVNFTAGQTQRMRFYLEEKRSGLTYSRGCLEPCNELIVASFQTDKNQYNAGDTILITNNCTGASKFYWLLNGQFVSSDSSPKIIAFGNGPSILELLVWNDNVNCDSVSVSAIINIDCVTRAFIENTISDGKLIVKSKSVFFDSIYTKIEKQDSIFYSTNKELDSIQLENGVFLITHIAFGHGCNDTIRVVFEINNIISEICDNDKDDDLDGFVDGYDDNCECNNNHFNGGCISNCEFIDSIYPIKMRQKWSTDILHDLEFNLSQFLIFDSLIINPFSLGSLDTSYHGFDLINAKNGVKIKRIISDTLINNFYWGRYFAITKMENSDLFYILYPTQDNRIILSDLSNNIIWSSKRYFNFYERPNYLKITDFNGDGSLEFYYGNRIFNFASGQLLFNGHESMGCISYPFKIAAPKLYEQCGWGAFSVAADLTSHQGLELAAGNVVYEVDLINLSDTINNTFEVKFAPSQVLDGATAVADVNSDGLLDVIVNRGAKNSESGGLWVWDPRTMEIIAEVIFPQLSLSHQPGYMNGGIPIIANVDDDCFPEIIVSFVNEIRIYKYTGGQNLNLLYSKPISDFSGVISASIFDLNWDNINELIIRDERYLRILNARTGTTIDSFEIHSGTLTEQPIIADIDNDRNAEILVSGYLPFEKDAQRIFCFESANLPWAPARSVWNQAGYHITNVNDDLTIPRQPQNNAAFFDTDSCAQTTCPQPYNTFMCQATYRTQDGCVKWPAVDLSVDALSYRCEPDSLYLTLVVRNQSDNALKKDSLALGIYEQGQEAPFHNQWIHLPKDANGQIVNADTITLAIANDKPNRTGLRFRINILDPSTTFSQNIKGLTAVLECDYGNNTDSLEIVPCVFFEICNDSLFNNQCPTTCVYSSDSLSHLELELKWKSEAVSPAKGVNSLYSNILSDSYGKLYTIYTANYSGKAISGVMTLEGKTGKLLEKSIPDTTIYTYPSQLLMFLNENDLNLIRYSYGLRNENANGGLNWFNDRYNGSAIYRTADLNEDGKTEIYGGDKIYNSQNGKIIFDGISSEGCNSWTLSPGNLCSAASNTVVADFTDSPGLELACGNIVYEFASYTDDTCMASSILAPFGVKDGFTATADINLDGQLDVVVVSSQVDGGKLWVWDPRTKKMIAEADSGIGGSLPAIANVDDDCYPEIVISYYNKVVVYKFDETTVLKELTEFPKEDNSGCTGISMFDFDQDGKHEIIFRDIKRLVIADGENGIVLGQVSINSGTAQEYPVIADIDGDNQAEILINGFEDSDPDSIRIFCFESANLPWAPARSVWNQAGYHITNVNDDLTIPRQPQNNAAFFDTDSCAQTTCPQPYNTFMCQATYRTQDGCVKWPAVDLSVDALSYRCEPDSLYLTLVVRNQSDNALKKDSLALGIYDQGQEAPFHNQWIHLPKDANGHIINADTITLAIANDRPNRTGLRFRINILDPSTTFSQNIKGLTAVLECDYLNNTDSLTLSLAPLSLDLGPDITKCRTSVFTLQAPTNFVSYVWSDGSTQDSYTSAAPGLHVLTATDVCGRIYTDSVRFEIDSTLIPHLGNDTLICEDQLLIYDLAGFDQVQWLPGPAVSCDTCLQTIVISDTDINLVALTNVNGCFDVDTVNIAVQALKKRNENLTICKGDSVLFNQTYLSEPGSYEYRTGFCDSLVTLELNVLAPDSIMLPRQTICEGDSAFFLGKWWKTEINSTIKLKNQFDCDSFITFELRVIDTLFQRTNASVCQGDSLFANGQWLCSAGIYTFEYTTPQGCDSIEEVQLTLLPSYTLTESATLCAGDSLQRWGKWFKTTGTYSQAFVTQNGCDSTEVLQLTINPLITDNRQYEICEGSTLTLNGIEYDIAGTFTTQLPSITGCDTLLTFTLSFSDRIQKTENYTICTGDSININGQWINQAQTLQYTLEEAGCITEITAEVSLLPRDTSVLNELLCPGDSIFINGSWHMGNKDFSYALTGSDGCDSIVNAYITSLTWPQPPVVNLDCEVAAYEATINLLTPWQVTWSNGDTTATTQITSSPASATIHYGSRCFKTFDLMTTTLPDLNSLPSIADQNISTGQGLPLNVPLDASEWKIKWLPSTLTSCDTCFTTMLFTDTNATITLELTHISGCTYTRTFNLIVENPPAVIVIPNVLSPLTPGPNASWDFTLPPGYTLINASVYDRWGSRVFQGLPPWDGTFNNCPLLPGVYVYTIQYLDPTGNTVFLKGDVTLVR